MIAILAVLALTGCEPQASPPQSAASPLASSPTVIVVEVKKDGTISLNGERVSQEELEKRLRAIPPENTDLRLDPDEDANYRDVARAMAAVQRTGHAKYGVLGGT